MAMTDNMLSLIKAVAENNRGNARTAAIACCAEDTSKKNAAFCKKYRDMLITGGPQFMKLPQNISGLVKMENVSQTFIPERFYVSEREERVYEKIMQTKAVSDRLMEMRISRPNRTLLHGESGTGKTTFAKYIAYKMGLPFCYLNFSMLIDSMMGGTAKNLFRVFGFAKQSPCVLMLDELDAISVNRSNVKEGGGSADGEISRITITLMQELDTLTPNVVLIAATNRLDRIDDAVLRRFPVIHKIDKLYPEEAFTMARQYADDVNRYNNILEFTDAEIEECIVNEDRIVTTQSRIIDNLNDFIADKIAGMGLAT